MDNKGVSNLYRTLNKKGNQIIGEIHHKWEEKTTLNFEIIDISRSFVYHNSIFKDCYLKYTRFRTLQRRFYTNDKLYKMGIKNTDRCTFCQEDSDSVEHMLLRCDKIKNFWNGIQNWIIEIGFIGLPLTESKIILCDLDNGQTITTIILLSKKVIYNSFKRGKIPSLSHVKNETKNFFYLEKYSFYLKHKSHIFEKRWNLLNTYYNKQKQR